MREKTKIILFVSLIEFIFMKETKPGSYSNMPEMVAKLDAEIPAEPNTIDLHSNGFDICFDYDPFSYKPIVTVSHGVSIKMVGSELAMRLGFTENEILRGLTSIVSPFLANMEQYTALYVYIDIIHNQLVGNVRTPLLRDIIETWRHNMCNL